MFFENDIMVVAVNIMFWRRQVADEMRLVGGVCDLDEEVGKLVVF